MISNSFFYSSNNNNCQVCNFKKISGNQYMTLSNEIVCGSCYVLIHGTRSDLYPDNKVFIESNTQDNINLVHNYNNMNEQTNIKNQSEVLT